MRWCNRDGFPASLVSVVPDSGFLLLQILCCVRANSNNVRDSLTSDQERKKNSFCNSFKVRSQLKFTKMHMLASRCTSSVKLFKLFHISPMFNRIQGQ
jgi:hypothetical protein